MPAFVTRRKMLGARPQCGFALNAASSLARQLAAWQPGGLCWDMVMRAPIMPSNNGTISAGNNGAGIGYGMPAGASANTPRWTGPSIAASVPFTLSMWVTRRTEGPSDNALWRSNFNSGVEQNYTGVWLAHSNTLGFGFRVNYGDGKGAGPNERRTAQTGVNHGLGLLHCVAVCRGATDFSMYVNGRAFAVTTSGAGGSVANSSGGCQYGVNGASNATANAIIHDVALWTRELTAGEIASLYHPQTRWALYWVPNRVYVDLATPAFRAAWARGSNTLLGGVQ